MTVSGRRPSAVRVDYLRIPCLDMALGGEAGLLVRGVVLKQSENAASPAAWLCYQGSADQDPAACRSCRSCRCIPRVPPRYETRMTHRGAIACVGQKSLHLKQPMHDWAWMGSALWCTIVKTPIEQRSTQIPQPLQKIRSTYTSIKIDGEGPISKTTSLVRFHSLVTNKFDVSAHGNEEDYPLKTA
jgi:hypothetical protein